MCTEQRWQTERGFHYRWVVKSGGIYLFIQLTDWLLIEVALLLIGMTQISLTKYSFNRSSVIESSQAAASD